MLNKSFNKNVFQTLFFGLLIISLLSTCQAQKDKDKESKSQQQTTGQMQPVSPGDIEVSDKEVEQFISLNQEIRQNQSKFQQQFMNMLNNSTLGLKKYQAMAQAMNNPNDTSKGSFSDADIETYNELTKELQGMQKKAQEEAQGVIQSAEMTEQRFKAIAGAARQDTSLQKRLREEMMKQMQQQSGGMPGGAPMNK